MMKSTCIKGIRFVIIRHKQELTILHSWLLAIQFHALLARDTSPFFSIQVCLPLLPRFRSRSIAHVGRDRNDSGELRSYLDDAC